MILYFIPSNRNRKQKFLEKLSWEHLILIYCPNEVDIITLEMKTCKDEKWFNSIAFDVPWPNKAPNRPRHRIKVRATKPLCPAILYIVNDSKSPIRFTRNISSDAWRRRKLWRKKESFSMRRKSKFTYYVTGIFVDCSPFFIVEEWMCPVMDPKGIYENEI